MAVKGVIPKTKREQLARATKTSKVGVHVPDAAGANPTKAEFDALLDSLRTAGVIEAE